MIIGDVLIFCDCTYMGTFGKEQYLTCVLTRDRLKLIFINSAETETGPKYSNVVSAENETEAEF